MRTRTEILIAALRQLEKDIQSQDGIPNATVAEAALRLEELQAELGKYYASAKPRSVEKDEIKSKILALAEAVKNQPLDFYHTQHPIYVCKRLVRYYGAERAYSPNEPVWLDENGKEVDEETAELLYRLDHTWEKTLNQVEFQKKFEKTYYWDEWEHVASFLSEKNCRDYMEVNDYCIRTSRQKVVDVQMFVDTAYPNEEMVLLRNFLISIDAANFSF